MAAQLAEVMARAEGALSVVGRHLNVSAAFLFGSQVEGGADEHSDIDIAVFAPGVEMWSFVEHVNAATRIQAELSNDIELHFFPDDQLEHCHPASFAAYVQKHGAPIKLSVVGRVAERGDEYEAPDAAP
jgi:predicted nucleotidyltransferase